MATQREYVSPDQVLRLLVVVGDDGDISVGFDGCDWHTHGDLLAALTRVSEPEAVERFVQDVLGNHAVIAVSRMEGEVRDIWVSADPASELQYLARGESLELRYWDGRGWSA